METHHQPMQTPQFCVVIPVLNERGNIAPLVDDGSTGGSVEQAEQVATATGSSRLGHPDTSCGQNSAARVSGPFARRAVHYVAPNQVETSIAMGRAGNNRAGGATRPGRQASGMGEAWRSETLKESVT